ncbi:tRNA pseudouridine(55) synthase TruB [Paenibacillus sp. FSL H8-0548]|uniref:tRNA pseudouridine(55) synthase TruB n=1 Tax=Paenibacillus sp. FSL H8-0548 TaxID=1920422 RepID=UPI00096DE30D|nr:tRNA pseudouridine(55) synthase TruB [Paenibacillus sp. FSL H8-0548]OMF36762.1 tRNA pseudouridine(55) synthase TruB [Paenibacillus sp. FSL H8-0548]
MDGILAVWKPEGWTSHDVVAKVRRILKMKRIGHAGTLDPMVTGVLPLCLGRATRVVEYVQERPKSYEAVLQLGIATDTEDITGTVIEQQSSVTVTEEAIREALLRFVGEIEQVPPMYSAVKIDGKRLYELAREGKTVERKSRKVTIHQIDLINVQLELEQPKITFSVVCSKGTYIRTLCVDVGKALGVPATMAHLTRTMSGGITKESCLTLEQIEELQQSGQLSEHLIAADEAITHLAKAVVPESIGRLALLGQKVSLSHADREASSSEDGQLIRLYNDQSLFLGIYQIDQKLAVFKPVKVFSA